MENVLTLLVIAPLAYLAGSVNFSIVLFRLLGRDDPRTRFSTNPGVTNVYRQAGRLWALLVLLLDLGRASALACISLRLLPPAFLPWCALFLLLGNMYPLFHGFKGGKGVANYLGFTLVPAPWFAAAAAAVWLLFFKITRQPFFGSFGMIVALSLGLAWRAGFDILSVLGALVNTGLIVYAHRGNLEDLFSRTR